MRKDYFNLFMNRKEVKLNLKNIPSNTQKEELLRFFEWNGGYRKSEYWFKQLSIWINLGVTDFIERKKKLEILGTQKLNLEISIIRYGNIEGTKIYENKKLQDIKNFKNIKDNWKNSGLSEAEVEKSIRDIQTSRSLRGLESKNNNGGPRYYSIRCKEYWTRKGYNEEESINIVSKCQARGEEFFIQKYGKEKGKEKFKNISLSKIKTWSNKTKEEMKSHYFKTLPKKYNSHGLEIKNIQKFIKENNIDENCCMYGSPADQFYQYIPNVGFRRYDLAVFEEVDKINLKIIFEYHGYGHINFSDYDESMKNKKFTSKNGFELDFLPTIGYSYNNDMIKRNHILNKFKNVNYIVKWPSK